TAPRMRRILILAGLLAVVGATLGLGLLWAERSRDERQISLDELARGIKRGEISEIRLSDGGGLARTRADETVSFHTGQGPSALKLLPRYGVTADQLTRVTFTVAELPSAWMGVLATFGPLVLFGAIMLYFLRGFGNRGGGNPLLSFGRSGA